MGFFFLLQPDTSNLSLLSFPEKESFLNQNASVTPKSEIRNPKISTISKSHLPSGTVRANRTTRASSCGSFLHIVPRGISALQQIITELDLLTRLASRPEALCARHPRANPQSFPYAKTFEDKSAMAPNISITYFDTQGLAEPIRWALELSGLDWEDKRLSFEEFSAIKAGEET